MRFISLTILTAVVYLPNGGCGHWQKCKEVVPVHRALGAKAPAINSRQEPVWADTRLFRFLNLSRWNNAKTSLQILLESNDQLPQPSTTIIRARVWDKGGRLLCQTTFTTGYRCYLRGCHVRWLHSPPTPCIVLETGPLAGPGPDFAREYVALVGRRFDLIRLEDSAGTATRNFYSGRSFFCAGPVAPQQAPTTWAMDLLSKDRYRILRALTWLGAQREQGDSYYAPGTEGSNDMRAARDTWELKGARSRVRELALSDDKWIRQAARLVTSQTK